MFKAPSRCLASFMILSSHILIEAANLISLSGRVTANNGTVPLPFCQVCIYLSKNSTFITQCRPYEHRYLTHGRAALRPLL